MGGGSYRKLKKILEEGEEEAEERRQLEGAERVFGMEDGGEKSHGEATKRKLNNPTGSTPVTQKRKFRMSCEGEKKRESIRQKQETRMDRRWIYWFVASNGKTPLGKSDNWISCWCK